MADGQPATGEQGNNGPAEGQGAGTGPAAAGAPAPETGQEQDLASEVAKWKHLARHNEDRAKANADAAAKLQQIEDSQKTEQQKLADRAAAAERRAADAELRVLRSEVAAAKGVPAALAARLQGATKEELEADADELLKTIPTAGTKPKTPPVGAVAGQGAPESGGKGRDVFASMFGARS